MWDAVVRLFFDLLLQIYHIVGDWGLAIIVFTVILRLLMTPLMIKQVRGMHEMQKHQPYLKEIQEKYKDDKEKQQQKILEYNSEHGVNYFGSCLPMLLQMPIFFALFQMLAAPTEKKPLGGPLSEYLLASDSSTGSFFGIIPDIMQSAGGAFEGQGWIAAIPYVIILVIFSLSIMVPQLMTPTADPSQKQTQRIMGVSMAAMMLFFGWSMPAGVLLYWDTSSIIGIAQQWFTQRTLKKTTEEAEEAEASSKKKSKKK